ncbi:hypothetical protein COU17_03120 [Candidatus Kaiserbacteria bacterium CG10_big_fil_rev_8_21_14_0_10_49_17]|uniref:Uncharacterized protein n=1 Tax=Candidatus Kaiserbacteria bacterium CG10_big_fil_rev_8_21_14_0_10_49_17 TaxID=1974609 RepID=A0A2M6WDT1_9BACT|nr:MAG: hypothetical protein COU17_03120 [Candidatus Kaiserbacteria bacterium CG10_big_fil_rev_8_21_14_0_10_49_17]
MNEQELTHTILRRVKRTYYLKQVLSPMLLKCYFFAVFLISIFTLVSVKDVFANMPDSLSELYAFMSYAFLHTEIAVQAALFGIAIALVLIVRDSLRSSVGGFAHAL